MSTGSDEATLPPGIGPEAAVEQILAFLGKDEYLTARRLAREAARRFPDHARVRKIAGVFDPRGKAVVRPGGPRQPDRSREFEWLRHPPDWAHGKWVALAGDEVVAADESLAEVERIVRIRKLSTRPLVHRIE
ncbi:MAG TPA: hypothetical protein VGG06_24995 [Thermoanaerobaculia bacterium]